MEQLFKQNETFVNVKETLECTELKKLRMANIFKALKLQIEKSRLVKIIYNSDQGLDRVVTAGIVGYNDWRIGISGSRYIPVRAIKEIRFR